MNLILFIHEESLKKGSALKKIIDQNFYGTELTTVHTFISLKTKLKKSFSPSENEILILFAESRNRLDELTDLIDLMEGKRIILILPDESRATLSIASRFSPRFLTYRNDTYDDLCDVLNNMINKNK